MNFKKRKKEIFLGNVPRKKHTNFHCSPSICKKYGGGVSPWTGEGGEGTGWVSS